MFEVRSAFADKVEKSASVVVREVGISDEEDSQSTHSLSLILYDTDTI